MRHTHSRVTHIWRSSATCSSSRLRSVISFAFSQSSSSSEVTTVRRGPISPGASLDRQPGGR